MVTGVSNSLSEFGLIDFLRRNQTWHNQDVLIGMGDDAAMIDVSAHHQLLAATDVLVSGIHFVEEANPADIAYKALAVNLSDFAAMGAEPKWILLTLVLPEIDSDWVQAFQTSFFQTCHHYQIELIGGDVSKGPLMISISMLGQANKDQVLTRRGAQAGDKIYVTGELGDAGAGLSLLQGKLHATEEVSSHLLTKLNRPTPRLSVGKSLLGIASAAIDISDGLLADLGHLLSSDELGANIDVEHLPISSALASLLSPEASWGYALNAGDDYELCFTVSPNQRARLRELIPQFDCRCTCIGVVTKAKGCRLQRADGGVFELKQQGYEHFSGSTPDAGDKK